MKAAPNISKARKQQKLLAEHPELLPGFSASNSRKSVAAAEILDEDSARLNGVAAILELYANTHSGDHADAIYAAKDIVDVVNARMSIIAADMRKSKGGRHG